MNLSLEYHNVKWVIETREDTLPSTMSLSQDSWTKSMMKLDDIMEEIAEGKFLAVSMSFQGDGNQGIEYQSLCGEHCFDYNWFL